MTLLDPQQLVSIVSQYYPHDLSDPNFKTSPEKGAFFEVWDRAMRDEYDRWCQTVKTIREALPGITVGNATAPHTCGSFGCVAYVKDQRLIAEAELETMVMAFRSVLAPVYGLAWAQRIVVPRRAITEPVVPWQAASVEVPEDLQPFAEVMAQQSSGIMAFSGCP